MKYSLGIDIGSANAKLALVREDYATVTLDQEKITTIPKAAVSSLLGRLQTQVDLAEIVSAAVSGSGSSTIPAELEWAEYSSSLAISAGLLRKHPDARTIVQIGGQSSFVIVLEDGLTRPWKVFSNPLCAAGTGRFLEQQAYRLGLSLEELSSIALEFEGIPPRIAARCSVFAKTDLIHLQQKGVPLAAMLCGLCGSIARMVVSLKKGSFEPPVYLVGGVAANKALVRSLNEVLAQRNARPVNITVPDDYLHMEALGSAVLALDAGKTSRVTMLDERESKQFSFGRPGLGMSTLDSSVWKPKEIREPFTGYLGVDVGSTSTKAVIIGKTGSEVVSKHYLMTAGRPVDAIKDVFRHLFDHVGENAKIAGVGVTGSGRYLVGSFIGADLIKNEITAQTRAAAELDPEADIIEIGGQDSKLVIKRNGVVIDYQMNKACAAGTGSFIDELAELLGIRVQNGEFAQLAFKATHTIDLGTRCAAFMEQAVASAQQEGVPVEVLTASLANSITGNYLANLVEKRKLGDKVILTGAVFYNQAVVASFKQALPGKTIILPEHKEVSGAIGAALLARENSHGAPSSFKGFRNVIESTHKLTTFTCKSCDNNCTISRLDITGGKPTYYGSRCDRFDSLTSHEKVETAFDEREQLLFRHKSQGSASGPLVGIPRGLLVYDFAPLLMGFLKHLGARIVLSNKTNKEIMEQATELSYTDSCFPLKLLHGHVASLRDVEYILYPCAIRLALKEGDEDQKYSCPLVQASPFIVRQAISLKPKLLIPIMDFSVGDKDVIKNLADVAEEMGYSRKEGKKAAAAGIAAQHDFQAVMEEKGKHLIQKIHQSGRLGVVIMARSYMAQDAGANMGVAQELARLGVVPIPMDYLPLRSVNVKNYSDRPYWAYESKHIAAAEITALDPQLFGLVITNFGCGPNSFILNLVSDIMGNKPMGQLEIDEHAAEAGLITRLEAFVDTIRGYARSGNSRIAPVQKPNIRRQAPVSFHANKKTILVPPMAPHAKVLAAAMEACGVRTQVLPEPDERNIYYSNKVCTGKECLPYRVTLGGFMRVFYDGIEGLDPHNVEGFLASAYGPCRFGKYAVEQSRLLREIGFDLTIRTTVSNTAYSDLNLGPNFDKYAWKGIVAIDELERLLWRARPYEKEPGKSEEMFDYYLDKIADRIRTKQAVDDVLSHATADFKHNIDFDLPRRPLVGINGEIFLRANKFSNNNLVKECERAGLEVTVSPLGEWFKYLTLRKIEDGIRDREFKKILAGYLRKVWMEQAERSVILNFTELLGTDEPSIPEILEISGQYISPKCGSEAVISIGVGVDWLRNPHFAGVISVMPHGCMPGGIVAAMSETFSAMYGKPWINLTYDGFLETNNLAKIGNFAEVIRFCRKG